jgi:MFS family permease
VAITIVFAGNGVLFASLFARMPEVQHRLGLDEGALGLALLAAPLGLIGSVALAGPAVARRGSRRIAALGAAGLATSLVLPALAPNLAALALALFVLGATSGALDVAMNTQGLAIERRHPRRIFASLHAGYSLGALAGAASAGLIAHAGIPLTAHLLAVSALVAAALTLAIRTFAGDDDAPALQPPRARRPAVSPPSRAVVGLGAVAFCVLLAEGAMNDWSAVYLARVHGAAAGTAAAGLAVVSLCMGAGRLAGDRLAGVVGSRALLCGGLVAGAVGFGAVAPGAGAVLVAYAGIGLALASVYPLVMRAAGARGDVPAGVAIGAVTTLGYVGFLLGPPAVGLVAHVSSLRVSLAVVGGLCLVAAWPALAVTDESRRRSRSQHACKCPPRARSNAPTSS